MEYTEFEPFNQPGEPIRLAISDYTVNTGLYVAHIDKLLKYTITNEMIPASSPIKLNTNSLALIIPGISVMYPN